MQNLKGLNVIRTMQTTKSRSMPRDPSQAYLDMFILKRDKERLLREEERRGMREKDLKGRMAEADRELGKLLRRENLEHLVKDSDSKGKTGDIKSKGSKSKKSSGHTSTQKYEDKKENINKLLGVKDLLKASDCKSFSGHTSTQKYGGKKKLRKMTLNY